MTHATLHDLPGAIGSGLVEGTLAPYLGPGMLALCDGAAPPPDAAALAAALAARVTVPGRLRNRLTATAQVVSDADFVEVLTEIDIQTPIPALVQRRRASLGFVFLGCRFDDQLPRAFARQILKRSAGPRYAVLPDTPTRMEARFLDETGITRIAMPLAAVAARLTAIAPAAA